MGSTQEINRDVCGFNNVKLRNKCHNEPLKKYYCPMCEFHFCKEHKWRKYHHCPYCEVQQAVDYVTEIMTGDEYNWFSNEHMITAVQFVRHLPEQELGTLRGSRRLPGRTSVSD